MSPAAVTQNLLMESEEKNVIDDVKRKDKTRILGRNLELKQ